VRPSFIVRDSWIIGKGFDLVVANNRNLSFFETIGSGIYHIPAAGQQRHTWRHWSIS
jgi:hypothetical protein